MALALRTSLYTDEQTACQLPLFCLLSSDQGVVVALCREKQGGGRAVHALFECAGWGIVARFMCTLTAF
ncbi:hypothetical protein D0844_09040 [Bordetella avium]|nr:hypothetical protein D0432_11025 [Bordetella avium]RIQ54032.1 hypothetical protein D0844_09040 [Bordetella avium]RIQ58673.1 hypothetical protein D0841_09015 [Bordetella avium]RIQ62432.1 hypothetical protein D0840_10515 [Bordetella avium]RIQ63555.1 hypothetical protein D0842_07985 [Bordetella avium]